MHTVSISLNENVTRFRALFSDIATLKERSFQNAADPALRGTLFFLDGLASGSLINEHLLEPLQNASPAPGRHSIKEICDAFVPIGDVRVAQGFTEIETAVVYGDTVLFLAGCDAAALFDTKGWQTRSIAEPESEKILSGPREGFTESILINASLLRRRLRSAGFKMESVSIGRISHTSALLCYIEGIVSPELVPTVKNRLSAIDIDGIPDSNVINELMHRRLAPLPAMGTTERADVAAAKLLEGRVVLLVDGTPVALSAPYLLIEAFQSNEDYYVHYLYAAVGRMLRVLAFLVTTTLPALYVALVTRHPGLIPMQLMSAIIASRRQVPFSTLLETLLMLTVFAVLRETGIRVPTGIGEALGIVGALVIGQATVEARLVSAPLLILIAMTGITGMMLPKLRTPVIFFRLVLLFSGALFGLGGILLSGTGLALFLLRAHSFGVPVLGVPLHLKWQAVKDLLIRTPWWNMLTRPEVLSPNHERMGRTKK